MSRLFPRANFSPVAAVPMRLDAENGHLSDGDFRQAASRDVSPFFVRSQQLCYVAGPLWAPPFFLTNAHAWLA
jgi:hypothetical protein